MTILDDVKTSIGVINDNLGFDNELLRHINYARTILVQLGVPQFQTLYIDAQTEWPTFANETMSSLVEEYFNVKVQQLFDPIPSGPINESRNNSILELEGRILHEAEEIGEELETGSVIHTHTEADLTDLDKYTQAEIDAALATKSDISHIHPGGDHTHTESNVTDLDKYTQAEVDAIAATKAASVHTHTESDVTDLDKYTQSEVDAIAATKAAASHTHTESEITDLGSYIEDITSESIGDLSDVDIVTPADNEVLAYDTASGHVKNQTPAEAGLSEVGHSHTESDVTDLDKYTQAQVDAAIDADISAHAGTNTHAQLDSHVASSANPHGVTAAQAGAIPEEASSTDNALVRWDGVGGDAVQNSGVTLDDANTLNMADNIITRAVLKDTGEAGEIDTSSTATKTLDIATQGNNFDITLDSNCTLTFSNPSAAGTWCWLSLILRQDGTGNRTVTWPGSVDWGDAGAPTLKTGANEYDIFAFLTVDGGTTWMGTALYASELADHVALTAAHGATGAVVGTTNTQTLTNKTLAASTLSGQMSANDNTIERPVLKDYGEALSTVSSSGATQTLNCETANNFDITLSANCTFTFSNPPASGTVGSITVILRQDGTGNRTVTWPTSVDWPAATAPTLSAGANDVDVFTFMTVDGGTTWLGFTSGLDLS